MASARDHSVDLLGLTVNEPAAAIEPSTAIEPSLSVTSGTDAAGLPDLLTSTTTVTNEDLRMSPLTASASMLSNVEDTEEGCRRFLVRCEGRWRVRSSPSLISKVLGTIANGTIVLVKDQQNVGLWIRVAQFEVQEKYGISTIKRDLSSDGYMYCLRRNALGYGLYEIGVEPLDGPLVTLPDELTSELQSEAQQATADKTEDVSLTWKLLGAAESVTQFVMNLAPSQDPASSEDMRLMMMKRPQDVFEVKQREQLKKAACNLKEITKCIIDAMHDSNDDPTVALSPEVRGRFIRLRQSLSQAAMATPLVVLAPTSNVVDVPAPQLAPADDEPHSVVIGNGLDWQEATGPKGELIKFVEHCTRLERSESWPELCLATKQEVVNFSQKHLRDLEEHVRFLAKAKRTTPLAVKAGTLESTRDFSTDLLFDELLPMETPCFANGMVPVSACAGSATLPLLPPPPPPVSCVKTVNVRR